jgi:hypothetical protein
MQNCLSFQNSHTSPSSLPVCCPPTVLCPPLPSRCALCNMNLPCRCPHSSVFCFLCFSEGVTDLRRYEKKKNGGCMSWCSRCRSIICLALALSSLHAACMDDRFVLRLKLDLPNVLVAVLAIFGSNYLRFFLRLPWILTFIVILLSYPSSFLVCFGTYFSILYICPNHLQCEFSDLLTFLNF